MLLGPDKATYVGLRDFSIMVLILDCGIRVGELCELTEDDIDLKNSMIYVRSEISKTRRYRQLPIGKQSCVLLKNLLQINKENGCKYVFNNSNTGEKINKLSIISAFEKYGQKVGLKVRCTPHVFRHVFATSGIKAGMDVFTLQKMLGHTTLNTSRKYVQLENSDLLKNHSKTNFVDKYLK